MQVNITGQPVPIKGMGTEMRVLSNAPEVIRRVEHMNANSGSNENIWNEIKAGSNAAWKRKEARIRQLAESFRAEGRPEKPPPRVYE